jgi:hypothetical protein
LQGRELRNHFERFDERLDAWRNSDPPYWIDSNIYPTNEPYAVISDVQGQEVKETRALHPDYKIHFYGKSYDLKVVMEAIDNRQAI